MPPWHPPLALAKPARRHSGQTLTLEGLAFDKGINAGATSFWQSSRLTPADTTPLAKWRSTSSEASAAASPPLWKRPASQNISANWPRLAEAGRGWPRLEAALNLIWRRRGVPEEGELAGASARLVSTYACAAALKCGQRTEAAGQDDV